MGFIDDLKSAVVGFGVPDEGETWFERFFGEKGNPKQAAYTPPSGVRITFDFADLSYRREKKTSAYEFSDADGTLVQDHGPGGRRYPMLIFLAGKDYDKAAKVFEAALDETGVAKLEHPVYGDLDVVPFGEYERQDNLVSGANQAIFSVTFFDTIGTSYPEAADDAASAALTALALFGDASVADFASSLDLPGAEQSWLDKINNSIDKVGDQLDKVAAVQDVVREQMEDVQGTLDNAIQTFVGDPLTIAFDTVTLINTPSKTMTSITQKLQAYGNLTQDIFSTPVTLPGGPGGKGPKFDSNAGSGNNSEGPNSFHTDAFVASNCVAGAASSTIYTSTKTGGAAAIAAVKRLQNDAESKEQGESGSAFVYATEALEAAEDLLNRLEDLNAWKDENYKSINGGNLTASEQLEFLSTPANLDSGNSQKHLTDAISLAAGYLIEMSFSLLKKRTITLTNSRSVLDLCAELYGAVDDNTLNFFINSNNLVASQILELDKGTKIDYYVV